MAQRASKSRLADWNASSTHGAAFFGSASFPPALIGEIEAKDPAGWLMPLAAKATALPPLQQPKHDTLVPVVKSSVVARLNKSLKGKAIFNLAGGNDKLVPYECSKPFMDFLKGAADPKDGWWKDGGLLVLDKVYKGVKHETTPQMATEAVVFLGDIVEGKIPVGNGVKSRI
jgi:hypothetical protein